MKKWFSFAKDDFLKKEFVPLKILYFFMIGGMTTMFPFLTIQARAVGINTQELGIIHAFVIIVAIFAPTISGLIGDRIGNYKILLLVSVILSGVSGPLFLLVPHARITQPMPKNLPFNVNCTSQEINIEVAKPFTCEIKEAGNVTSHTLNVEYCYVKCLHHQRLSSTEILDNWCTDNRNCLLYYNRKENGEHFYEFVNNKNDYNFSEEWNYFRFNLKNLSLPLDVATEVDGKNNFLIDESFCPANMKWAENGVCWLECEAYAESNKICSNKESTETLNPPLAILIYVIVRLINSLTLAMSYTLFEGAVVSIIKDQKGDLGLQRLYGNIGVIILTPISGQLIDHFSKLHQTENFAPAFYLYFVVKLISAFFFLFLNLEFKKPSSSVFKDFKSLLKQPHIFTFIIFVLFAGSFAGFTETFLFWLLEDLGADKKLMGITVTIGSLFGIPFLFCSSHFIRKIGHVNVLLVCMLFYSVRLIGYSFIKNAWLAMPFEALEGITNSLMIVTCISFAAILSKPNTIASLQGLYAGVHHGAGRGVGSIVGGVLIKKLGEVTAFQIMAVGCIIVGLVYFLVKILVLGKIKIDESQNEIKDDRMTLDNQEL